MGTRGPDLAANPAPVRRRREFGLVVAAGLVAIHTVNACGGEVARGATVAASGGTAGAGVGGADGGALVIGLAGWATANESGGTPPANCVYPDIPCGNRCVNQQLDPNNCGVCGRTCPASVPCSGGQCVCDNGTLCGSGCVDLMADRANCGVCDNVCAAAEVCLGGSCIGGSGGTTSAGGAPAGGNANGGVEAATGGFGTGGGATGGAASWPWCDTVETLPAMGAACARTGESQCDPSGHRCVCTRGVWYCDTSCASTYPIEPTPGSACIRGAACNYPSGLDCTCINLSWMCVGSSACPAAASMAETGQACDGLTGVVCDYPNVNPPVQTTCACTANGGASTGSTWNCESPTCPATQPVYSLADACPGGAFCSYGSTHCTCWTAGSPWVCGFGIFPYYLPDGPEG